MVCASKFGRQFEFNVLLNPAHLRNLNVARDALKRIEDTSNERLRRGCSGGEANRSFAVQPSWLQFGSVADEVAWKTFLYAYFSKAIGIGTILGTDDQDDIGNLAKRPNG
jgi:hypothetical protein